MNNTVRNRLSRFSIFTTCRQCLQRALQPSRGFASGVRLQADSKSSPMDLDSILRSNRDRDLASLAIFGNRNMPSGSDQSPLSFSSLIDDEKAPKEAHHLHIYAHKHNTHITLTRPNHNYLISLSTGNIGFRKSARGTYDAAYQLAAYVLAQVKEKGFLNDIEQLEVILRGWGVGREAVTKALLGTEGRFVRDKISKVSDATRLKFGGTRSRKPRRLG